MLFSTWDTFSKKRFEQGFLQGYAKSHGGQEALERYYGECDGRNAKAIRSVEARNERESSAQPIIELEKAIDERDLMTRIIDALEKEVEERKMLAKRIAELEKVIEERDQ